MPSGNEEPYYKRLIPALPAGDFVELPEEIDRFLIRLCPDGTIYFKGNEQRIEDFLHMCQQAGLTVHLDHIALCG